MPHPSCGSSVTFVETGAQEPSSVFTFNGTTDMRNNFWPSSRPYVVVYSDCATTSAEAKSTLAGSTATASGFEGASGSGADGSTSKSPVTAVLGTSFTGGEGIKPTSDPLTGHAAAAHCTGCNTVTVSRRTSSIAARANTGV